MGAYERTTRRREKMKYLVAIDGSKDSEMAFDVVLSKATQEDHVFLLMVAEEVYISTVAGASAYIDYSYIVRANQKIEEEGKALLKSYGRRLTERKLALRLLHPPPKSCKCSSCPLSLRSFFSHTQTTANKQ